MRVIAGALLAPFESLRERSTLRRTVPSARATEASTPNAASVPRI